MIEIVFFDTKKLPRGTSLEFLIKNFSDKDRERALRYRTLQDGINFAIGRLMLQNILKSKGMNPALIHHLSYNNSGKPTLPNLFFNISHSSTYVVCAFSEEIEMGIDIEVIREMEIANFKSWFTAKEWAIILNSSNSSVSLLNYWTAKESVLKVVGTDLAKAAEIEVINKDKAVYKEEVWGLRCFELGGGKVIGYVCSDVSQLQTATICEGDWACLL